MAARGFPTPHNQPPYPMAQPAGQIIAPLPGGFVQPAAQPPPAGLHVGFNAAPPQTPVVLQPRPVVHRPAAVAVHTPTPAIAQVARPISGKDKRAPGGVSPVMLAAPGMVPVGVPPGLEYLTQIDQILVHQKVELLEAFIGFETNNQYEIKNSLGQKMYTGQERNDCCTRNCCGSLRSFNMTIKDNMDRDVIRLIRPLRCMSCWFPCCLQEMEVQSPPGITIGYIKQDWHPFLPKLAVQGPNKQTVMMLEGPCCACNCCGDVHFELKALDSDKSIGRTSKQWSGMAREVFTDTDNFSIQFPLDLDVKMKAVLLGACFLIDFMFFEKVGRGIQKSTVFS